MLMLNLFNDYSLEDDVELDPAQYPVEVLESEWNPTVNEIHSSQHLTEEPESEKEDDLSE
ncbi:MAG: hypothetical protein KZQ85_17790 [Candidatus Thiodiazotropha sp. (ex Myrtea sp. 'scaly one' KF741663)]|nr:hypothetical protein [Candidatus Thiodiazotropha sp. (ex Myrtea sp. 'scaly one' KF741663)]